MSNPYRGLSPGLSGRVCEPDHLVPKLGTRGSLPLLPPYSFMAWCLDTGISLPPTNGNPSLILQYGFKTLIS